MEITPKHADPTVDNSRIITTNGGITSDRDDRSPAVTGATFAGFRCGHCGAEDIQRLSLVHESGTSVINARTSGIGTGVGIGRGGLGFGTAVTSSRTTGTQMSALAKRAAPPRPKYGMRWVAVGVVAAIVGMGLAGIVLTALLLAVCGVFAYRGIRYDQNVYPDLRRAWEQSWLCHRCGSVSQIAQS